MRTSGFKALLTVCTTALLFGCSGGNLESGNNNGGGGTTPTPKATPASVSLVTSSQTLGDNADGIGAPGITVTAIVTDANNNVVPNATVTFTACLIDTVAPNPNGCSQTLSTPTPRTGSPPAAFLGNPAVTSANGLATVTMTTGGNTSHGQILVGATVKGGAPGLVVNPVTVNVAAPAAGPSAAQPASVVLIASSPQLSSNSVQPANGINLTAFVKDASNNIIVGTPVSFSTTDAGVNLIVSRGTTDASGSAAAILTVGSDQSTRQVIVSATAGGAPAGQVTISIVGTTLTLSGPTSVQFGVPATYVATLKDSGGSGIFNQPITLSSPDGTFNPAAAQNTDSNGQVTVKFTPTTANPTATITASAYAGNPAQTTSQTVSVSTDSFVFTVPTPPPAATPQITLGANQTVTVHWTSAGSPVVGKTVNFSTTRGILSAPSAVTTAGGTATVTVSSTQAGPATIAANSTFGSQPSATLDVNFAATDPASINVQPDPATIGTNQQSTLTAIVRDASSNLVTGATVNFVQTQDTTGGRLSAGSAVTDSQGRAVVVYTASSTTSSANGIIITASVPNAANTQTFSATARLTVGGSALRIVLGSGNTITPIGTTQYQMPWSLLVTDSGGNPAANATVSLSLQDMKYRKGTSAFDTVNQVWFRTDGTGGAPIACTNEDLLTGNPNFDLNGFVDPGEDLNGNGTLEPGSIGSVPGTVQLDANGSASFDILYERSEAYWVNVRLRADVTVAGSQGVAEQFFDLPGLASDFNSPSVSPPGLNSPYGVLQDCAHEPVVNFATSKQSAFNGQDIRALITLSAPAGQNPITIPFTVTAGGAEVQNTNFTITSPATCTTANCSLTIPAGGSSSEIDLHLTNAAGVGDTVTLTLGTPNSQAVLGSTSIDTIVFGQAVVSFVASGESVSESTGGTTQITVKMDQAVGGPVTVAYATSGTAVAGTDYFISPASTSPLTIPAGSTTATITINPAAGQPGNKSAIFTLGAITGTATLGNQTQNFLTILP